MSFAVHNPAVRALVRKAGLNRIAYKVVRNTFGDCTQWEAKFAEKLLGSVSPGDCVWDVGANVGHYARQLAAKVGPAGRVVAFEPFETSYRELVSAVKDFPQVSCFKTALGAQEEDLLVEPIEHGPGCNLLSPSGHGEPVHVTTGMQVIRGGTPKPAVLKIDVEGFEEDVIWGIRDELKGGLCRRVFVEVHYDLLARRGFQRAPGRLVSLLRDLGFRTGWIDQSHLSASRIA